MACSTRADLLFLICLLNTLSAEQRGTEAKATLERFNRPIARLHYRAIGGFVRQPTVLQTLEHCLPLGWQPNFGYRFNASRALNAACTSRRDSTI